MILLEFENLYLINRHNTIYDGIATNRAPRDNQ